MENDDKQVGKILNRRDLLKLFGVAGVAALAACAPAVAGTPGSGGVVSQATNTAQPAATIPRAASATVIGNLPACIVRPAMTEGPYFVDEKLNRSDIRS